MCGGGDKAGVGGGFGSSFSSAMNIGLMLFVAATGMFLGILFGRAMPRLWLATTLVGVIPALVAAVAVLAGGNEWEWRGGFSIGGEPLHLRLDGVSALFLVLLCVVGGAASVYGREYWADAAHPRSARTGRVWWSVMLLSLGLVLLASNGLHFLIAWELFTLSAYFLITLDRQPARSARGGLALPRRLRTQPCSPSLPSSPRWRLAPEAGNSDPCANTPSWRRCSGWRFSGSA